MDKILAYIFFGLMAALYIYDGDTNYLICAVLALIEIRLTAIHETLKRKD